MTVKGRATRNWAFGLQELNKCKTELQFWRSKSHVLAGAAISGAIPGGSSSAAVTAAAAATFEVKFFRLAKF